MSRQKMKNKIPNLIIALIALAAAASGCTANKSDLAKTGQLTLKNQSEGKIYIAWSSASKQDQGFVITGVVRRHDRVGPAIKTHIDIEIISPEGQTINTARSSDIYVSVQRTGRFTPFKRFAVSFPSMPPQGASALIKPHTKPH
jgi:hypothetical protein